MQDPSLLLSIHIFVTSLKRSTDWFHSKLIPVRGKHLDELSAKDHLFIGMNRIATALPDIPRIVDGRITELAPDGVSQ